METLFAISSHTQEITYQHYIHKISSSQALHTSKNPYTRNKKT